MVAQRHTVDMYVPLLYRWRMDSMWLEEGGAVPARHEWKDDDGDSWLLEFYVANLRGRQECVGMTIRPIIGDGDLTLDLRPLRATTMRQLPFHDELTRARSDIPRMVEQIREWTGPDAEFFGELGRAESLVAETSQGAGTGRGKYSLRYLKHVANVYQAAFAAGDSAPSKCVEEQLKVTPDVARKLVHRCRDPRLSLLPPSEGRRPRGWLEGERDEVGPSRESGQDTSSERKETP